MPETLLESELFGHKKGAFTGATEDKKGLFELADGGTLFLDEIGEMPSRCRPRLLRVLQEGEVRPAGQQHHPQGRRAHRGGHQPQARERGARGALPQDLYYRLQVFPLRMPAAARARRRRAPARDALPRALQRASSGKPVATFSQQALELLRRLQLARQRARARERSAAPGDPDGRGRATSWRRAPEPRIGKVEGASTARPARRRQLKDMMEHIEKRAAHRGLCDEHGNNKSATAKTLGITREGLHKKLKKFGMG
jgi:DNA-binding NtrC family response regulator